ncbi:MAG: hypothetical protein JXO22_03125, partial [Phycisphaerae bacterium]|nr:hypothetical protein [Phycisphaerae bacterium]
MDHADEVETTAHHDAATANDTTPTGEAETPMNTDASRDTSVLYGRTHTGDIADELMYQGTPPTVGVPAQDEQSSPLADSPVDTDAEASTGDLMQPSFENQHAGANDNTPLPSLEDAFAGERDDVLTVINELEDQLDRYQGMREGLEAELSQRTTELQNAGQRIQELEWQIVTSQTRIEALEQVKQDSAQLEEELVDAGQRNQRLSEQLAVTEQDNAQLHHELKNLNRQLETLWTVRQERDGLKKDAQTLRTALSLLERKHRDLSAEQVTLRDKLSDTESNLAEARRTRAQVETDLRAAEDRNRATQQVVNDLEQRADALREERKSLQTQLTHLERENTRLAEQCQFHERELKSLRNMNRSAEHALSSVKQAFSEVRVALTETKARVRRRTTDDRTASIITRHRDASIDTVAMDTSTIVSDTEVETAPSDA